MEVLVRALLDELPELDPARVRAAVERATAKLANAALDTEGHRFVGHHLARVEATEEAAERARILRDEALELFYRSTGEWPVLVDLLGRRAVHVDGRARAELFRELGLIYERELGDDSGALDAYREADRLEPDHPDVLDAVARLELRVGGSDTEALITLERLAATRARAPRSACPAGDRAGAAAGGDDVRHRRPAGLCRPRADDGDLATCVRVLERQRTNATGEVNRIIELVWSSVTEDVLGVRSRVERWPTHPRAPEAHS